MTLVKGNDFISLSLSSSEEVSKQSIRQKVWDYLEEKNLAEFPRPVHHRIPNFKNAAQACSRIAQLDVFKKAITVKVNPDKPQQHIRYLSLEANKTLLVPTPRLRKGLLNHIIPPRGCSKQILQKCSTQQGVKEYSVPIPLNKPIKIDLIITGSVAVSKTGQRIGKGEGYADMEYAMMAATNAVNEDTLVITTVHDCQVFDELPQQLFGDHDLTVDCIITPTTVHWCEPRQPKPKGILWNLLSEQQLTEIPILKMIQFEDKKLGKDTTLKK